MNTAQQRLVDPGILEMLEKNSYLGCLKSKRRWISEQSSSCREERWEPSATRKFETAEKDIPYTHLNMKGLHYLKFMLQEEHCMCELELKDAYFSIPLYRDPRKMIRCQWS